MLVLPWALAGGCFLLGLGLGMLYALRTQVSGRPLQFSPTKEQRAVQGKREELQSSCWHGPQRPPTHLQGLGEAWASPHGPRTMRGRVGDDLLQAMVS